MKTLSRQTLQHLDHDLPAELPRSEYDQLPERILQFGTGVLLRGLPDLMVEQAQAQGLFQGRIVAVKSTSRGPSDAFQDQDGLYTVIIRGLQDGRRVERYQVCGSLSRVLEAQDSWNDVLQCASNPDLQLVISNTTESGIQLQQDDMWASPPTSFPGKLLAFLYARFKALEGRAGSGLVVLPTELISDNGTVLKGIVQELARMHNLDEVFMAWLETENEFCNTLVDRIVPGAPSREEHDKLERLLGYKDSLLITAEPYSLWAIEAHMERTQHLLNFATAVPGMVIAADIEKYRELKLRLLNATHSFSCALALLSGCGTVLEGMEHEQMRMFMHELTEDEIVPCIESARISRQEALSFAHAVLERFANPYIVHAWSSISLQYTLKMRMRCVPLIQEYYRRFQRVPRHMARGFAAYMLFMRSQKTPDGQWMSSCFDAPLPIRDDMAERFHQIWQEHPENPVMPVLRETSFWETDLSRLPGWAEAVDHYLHEALRTLPAGLPHL